jgi:O-antigen/teichoic acid export membrane protein
VTTAEAPLEADSIRRNAAFSLAVQLTGAAFTAALTLYLVRALGPRGYGLYALAVSVGALVLIPSDLGISSAAARFVAERRGDRRWIAALLADALTLKLAVSGLVSAALFGLASPIASAYGEPALAWPLRAVALAVFGHGLMLLFAISFIAQGRVAVNLRVAFSESVVETGTTIALVALGTGATGAAFGRTAGYLFGAAVGVAVTARLLGRSSVRLAAGRSGRLSQLVRYAGALFVVEAAFSAFGAIDAVLIGAYLSAASVGVFQAPVRLLVFLQYAGSALADGVAPRLARHAETPPNVAAFRGALRYVVLFYAPLTAALVVWAGPIADLLLGEGYEESADVLRALAPWVFLSGFAPLVSISANYLGEARRRVPVAVAAVVLKLALAVALIPEWGVVGAAVGSDIAFAVYVLAHFEICRRTLGLELGPLLATLGRAAVAAGAAAGVLLLAGTGDLSAAEWVLGGSAAVIAYGLVLVALRELTRDELGAAAARLRR